MVSLLGARLLALSLLSVLVFSYPTSLMSCSLSGKKQKTRDTGVRIEE